MLGFDFQKSLAYLEERDRKIHNYGWGSNDGIWLQMGTVETSVDWDWRMYIPERNNQT